MKALGRRSIASFIKGVLDVAWWASAVFLGLVLCLFVVSLFVHDLGPNVSLSLPVSFDVDSSAYRISAPSLGVENAEIRKVHGEVRFPVRKGPFFFDTLAGLAITLGFFLWVLAQLRRVFRTLRDGRPFDPANAARIRWIGLAIIAGELARAGMSYLWSSYFSTHFTATNVRFSPLPDFSFGVILNGLIVIVLAEVFREGARLREDQSLTI